MNENVTVNEQMAALQNPAQPQAPAPRKYKKFNLESSGYIDHLRKQAEMNGVQPFVNPLKPAAPQQEVPQTLQGSQMPNFDTPTAKFYHWKTDQFTQEVVDHFANCLGLAQDAYAQGDYTSTQRFLGDALTFAAQLGAGEQQTATLNYKDAKQRMREKDDWGIKLIDKYNEQGGMVPFERNHPHFIAQVQLQQQQQQMNGAPETNGETTTAVVPANTQLSQEDPQWKKVLSNVPVVGTMAKLLPNQQSIYDSTLNAVLGQNWQKWKPAVTYSLLGGSALATYYFLLKPWLFTKKDVAEEVVSKKRKRKNRRKPTIKRSIIKSKPKASISDESEEKPRKKRRRKRKKKPAASYELPKLPEFKIPDFK